VANELGHPYHPDSFSGWFDGRLKDADLPRITIQETRHTAGTLMLASGVPVKVVQEMLGHSDPPSPLRFMRTFCLGWRVKPERRCRSHCLGNW
jgi:integrase